MSLDYGGLLAEIKTVDAQESLNGGVLVLVTGNLIGKENVKRNFTQSFFLATQDKGYFVLNDIFRYVEEAGPLQGNQGLPNGTVAPPSPDQGIFWKHMSKVYKLIFIIFHFSYSSFACRGFFANRGTRFRTSQVSLRRR